jgi:hypothetical protein
MVGHVGLRECPLGSLLHQAEADAPQIEAVRVRPKPGFGPGSACLPIVHDVTHHVDVWNRSAG